MVFYKYMTELNDPKYLHKISVGQTQLIQNCIDRIKTSANGGSGCNILFIGSEGVGKSHVMSVVLQELSKFKNIIPVRIEDEYTILSLEDLCKRILNEIGEVYAGDDIVSYCRITMSKLKHKGSIIMLCVENLELLFDQIHADLGKLRSITQSDQSICIIGASRKYFDAITSPDEPFYRGFDVRKIHSLTNNQILELIKKRLALAQRQHLAESLEKYPRSIEDIMSIVNGNPRLAHILADIIIRQDSLYSLDINTILDSLTPQYIEKTNNLSIQQRKIYDHIALSGKSVSSTDLAQKIKIAKPVVITQLRRLRKKGLLEDVKLAGKKENRYGITDSRYSLWRQMRQKKV